MNKEPIRILHVLQRMEAGGTQALLMNIYRNIDRSKVQFDFLVEYTDKEFYDDEILSLGGKIYYTNLRKDKNILKFEKYLKRIIKENNYKVIHVHTYSIGYFVLKTAKKCGVPVRIAHSHSNSMTNDFKKILKKILQKLYTIYATNYMACSNEAGDYLFKNKNYQVLQNAIDTNKFVYNEKVREAIRKDLNLEQNFVIGHVGRFRPEKNHEFLIDVFNEIKKKKNNAKLLLVGNGDPNDLIRKKINDYNLNSDVIILQNRSDVNKIYQAMDVFVFPSIYEGLGIVAIEAQTSGLQVFASDTLPVEVELTENLYKLSLNLSPQMWAEKILNNYNPNNNKNTQEKIISNGFDINHTSLFLQDYYIKLYENCISNKLKNSKRIS